MTCVHVDDSFRQKFIAVCIYSFLNCNVAVCVCNTAVGYNALCLDIQCDPPLSPGPPDVVNEPAIVDVEGSVTIEWCQPRSTAQIIAYNIHIYRYVTTTQVQ